MPPAGRRSSTTPNVRLSVSAPFPEPPVVATGFAGATPVYSPAFTTTTSVTTPAPEMLVTRNVAAVTGVPPLAVTTSPSWYPEPPFPTLVMAMTPVSSV